MEATGGYVMRLISSGNEGEVPIRLNHYRWSTMTQEIRLEELL